MSGTLPINDFTQAVVTSNTPTMITTAVSGLRQAKQVATQFWTLEVEFRPLSFSEAKTVQGFLAKQRGSLYDFAVVIPRVSYASGGIKAVKAANPGVSSTMTTTTSYAIGANTISINTNYTGSQYTAAGATTILQAGDYIRFAGHSKVYQVVDDVSFNSGGDGSVTIFPSLVAAVTSGEAITYDAVPFQVFNSQATQDTTFTVGDEVSMSLKLQEAL